MRDGIFYFFEFSGLGVVDSGIVIYRAGFLVFTVKLLVKGIG